MAGVVEQAHRLARTEALQVLFERLLHGGAAGVELQVHLEAALTQRLGDGSGIVRRIPQRRVAVARIAEHQRDLRGPHDFQCAVGLRAEFGKRRGIEVATASAAAGEHPIRITVRDDEGRQGSALIRLTVK